MFFGKTIAVSCDSQRKHTKTRRGEYSSIFKFKGYGTLQELPSYRRDSRQLNVVTTSGKLAQNNGEAYYCVPVCVWR